MAGSFNHLISLGGTYTVEDTRDPIGTIGGWSMIENMGDAHECVEQLLWLALFLARLAGEKSQTDPLLLVRALLLELYYPMVRGEVPPNKDFQTVREVMAK